MSKIEPTPQDRERAARLLQAWWEDETGYRLDAWAGAKLTEAIARELATARAENWDAWAAIKATRERSDDKEERR